MSGAEGLFRSGLAVRALLALSQGGRPGSSLREIARCLRAVDSSVQRALSVLRDGKLLRRSRGRYRLRPSPVLDDLLAVTVSSLRRQEALRILACANCAVEYASLLESGPGVELIAILRNDRDHLAVAQLHRAIRSFRGEPAVTLTSEPHEDLIHDLRDPGSPAHGIRQRALAGRLLKGDPVRSLPDRLHRRSAHEGARLLHRPHPSVKLPRAEILRQIAGRFRLARISLFGSAVRGDFRSDSDIDVLIRYRPGTRRDLFEEIQLQDELAELFGRDVDLAVDHALRDEIRPSVEREAVTLHG